MDFLTLICLWFFPLCLCLPDLWQYSKYLSDPVMEAQFPEIVTARHFGETLSTCAIFCSKNIECVGFSLDKTNQECQIRTSPVIFKCEQGECIDSHIVHINLLNKGESMANGNLRIFSQTFNCFPNLQWAMINQGIDSQDPTTGPKPRLLLEVNHVK